MTRLAGETTMRFDMMRRFALAVAIICGATDASLAAVVNLYYDPVTGNLKLQNTTNTTVKFVSYQILTLGNGTYGPATPGGLGYLTGTTANIPPATTGFPTYNTDAAAENGLYSEISLTSFYNPTLFNPVLTLTAYAGWSTASPVGPAGSFFDLGNVAALGMTQTQLDARVITIPDISPGGEMGFGKFLFDYETTPGTNTGSIFGDVVAVVPEPSMLVLAMAAAAVGMVRRIGRSRT